MHLKGSNLEIVRVSVSSAHSTSSHGSAQDDYEPFGDVYVWGEVIQEDVNTSIAPRTDVLLPKPLECNAVLDVHHVACGVHHAALVTRQGEVFTWGEASGGRLGHGVGQDTTQPTLVQSLSSTPIDFVACGEFHTCAVTMSGDLYTWGDGTHNAGLLGHSNGVSHWIPKRIPGGLRVVSVACGPWHTALIASAGQLFTFGDGTFGVLGHGDRKSVLYPKEVESLSGLRTVAVACGVWHTAAVVEVIVTPIGNTFSSGKLFTWGDGDKYRLGHGDKESRLKPTCIPTLIDYDFLKVACGHSVTVGLTTSRHVCTMGSSVYGQLGNPQSDGKQPCLVEDKLPSGSVEDISCGAYHIAVLTLKNEVYTWGRGANGRLGHGDVDDRKTPTLVEALKDRHVEFIACGMNYTSAICLHKWVSGAEQSQCSGCRQAFGFTRKRHNCYNCGLVHCHTCSSQKAVRASMAPDPSKPYRVCDSCFTKLSKIAESRRKSMPWDSVENSMKLAKFAPMSNVDLMKALDAKAGKQGKKGDAFSTVFTKPIVTTTSSFNSRSVSPFSRKSTPPRSVTPVPTTSGLAYSKNFGDSLKKANELLSEEVRRLRVQVESLGNRCESQDLEIRKLSKKAQEAMALAADESMKCKAAKEVIKSLAAQLKDMAVRLPSGPHDPGSFKLAHFPELVDTNGALNFLTKGEARERGDDETSSVVSSLIHGGSELFEDGVRDNDNRSDITGASSNGTKGFCNNSRASNARENVVNSRKGVGEWTEQYEPGVYITLVALHDGSTDLKRVRFSRRKFGEREAERWWGEKGEKVYERYKVVGSDKSSIGGGLS